MIDAAFIRSTSIIDQSVMMSTDYNSPTTYTANNQSTTTGAQSGRLAEHQDKRTYLGNPSVTLTALAHSLWQSTIYPYHDTVIDATCGNGKDCLALAKMLFPGSIDGAKNHHENDISDAYPTENRIANGEQNFDWVATATPNTISTINTHKPKPRLIGIDIQPRAIANTQRSFLSLSSSSSEIYFKHVTLIEQSHENLIDIVSPVLGEDDCRSVGLVCYNLGFLPGAPSAPSTTSKNNNSNYKQCQTQTSTTLHSITDATLLLRVGGLLSIMTYPGSNMEESIVVEHFVEGLAMLTTREEGGWRGYAESIPDYGDGNDSSKINNDDDDDDDENKARVRRMVTHALERVAAEGTKDQTWRAFVHRPLGRRMSPVLITAMKIK